MAACKTLNHSTHTHTHTLFLSLSLFLPSLRQLYGLCQLFPAAACKAMQTLLGDSAHGIEETVEVTGRAPFPGLDTVLDFEPTF